MVRWSGPGAAGLLLRLGIVLTAVCASVHLYLESDRTRSGVHVTPGRTRSAVHVTPGRTRSAVHVTPGRTRSALDERPVKSEEQQLKRRITYIHSLRSPAGGSSASPSLGAHKKKTSRWNIHLQPFSSDRRSLEDEASRFLSYITTPQVSCSLTSSGESEHGANEGSWSVCLDPNYSLRRRMDDKHCRVYSFGLGMNEWALESSLSRAGCEVHCFDPGLKQPHLQQDDMWLHRLAVDWRDPNPALVRRQQSNTKKLATILNDFGHRKVDVLKADLESAEWKILENMILEGVLDSVGQLLLELHLHWPGFEVGGDEPSVVRYWFSLLKELESAGFKLFHVHRDPEKPRVFLHQSVLNASSSYTLSWVNTRDSSW